jgi:excisionase family DNA binding protein
MPDWITTGEGARLTGYTAENIRQLVKAGKVKGQRWGRDWQIDRRALLAYVRKAAKLGDKRGPKPRN